MVNGRAAVASNLNWSEGGTIFQPNPEVRAQAEAQRGEVTGEVGTRLALSGHQVEILAKCSEEQPLTALLKITGRSDRTKFRNQVLGPLLDQGLVEMTIPDKPRSSRQRYRTTRAGIEYLQKEKKMT